MNSQYFTPTIGILILIALIALIFIETTSKPKVVSVSKTTVVPVPVRRPPYVVSPYVRPPIRRYL